MKDTIKPVGGDPEMDQMKAEIHRMKVRLGQVVKKKKKKTLPSLKQQHFRILLLLTSCVRAYHMHFK